VLHRSLSQDIASSDVRLEEQGDISVSVRLLHVSQVLT
jgi:hypothetical protein